MLDPMHSATPLISVIVPVYNVADYIAACLHSLQAQTLQDFEVIVVDDGATDESAVRARAAVADDPRFVFLGQDNRGLSAARNTGLAKARGAFIAFVDSDDRVHPDYLAHLHRALEAHGADWAACAICYCNDDGSDVTHSAIHTAAALASPPAPRRYALDDWCDVIRHFPSAWNKLYRKSLIEGLRFQEGIWFEDHGFFLQAAARTDHLLHVPEPLYLQTQGRVGQITGADSDRVFDLFQVLEQVQVILDSSPRTGAREAFERLTTRLMSERSLALHDPTRRQRFAQACRDFLDRHGVQYAPDWDPALSRTWARVLAGVLPLSVVIPFGGADKTEEVIGLLADSLDSLQRQLLRDFEVLIICDSPAWAARANERLVTVDLTGESQVLIQPGQGAAAARDFGMTQAKGDLLVFLDAGDVFQPWTLLHWCDTLLREKADMGVSCFKVGLGGDTHNSFHGDPGLPLPPDSGPLDLSPADCLSLHAHPSAKIFRRAALCGPGFDCDVISGWHLVLHTALHADRIIYIPLAGVEVSEAPQARKVWHSTPRTRDLVSALDRLCNDPLLVQRLPKGWQRRLWARAMWEKYLFAAFPSGLARWLFILSMGLQARKRGIHRLGGTLDPFVNSRIIRLLISGRARR